MEFLPNRSILNLSQTCRALANYRTDNQVLQIILNNRRAELEDVVFGKKAWNTYFGDVGEVDSIPEELVRALEEPCPFTQGKRVKETHIVCWIPEKINGTCLSIKSLKQLVTKPLQGNASEIRRIQWPSKEERSSVTITRGHWILVTKTILKDSENQSYDEQKKRLESYHDYQMPSVLSFSVALFTHYARTGELFYGLHPSIYTRCQENADGLAVCAGAFGTIGLCILSNISNQVTLDDDGVPLHLKFLIGMGAVREFYTE
ncbi:MAG: hypothetical protein JSR58_07340 [Verrucomicrobia bacterium]|nr:hypothetical protein [Verrucomicrobiota bacterium]